MKRDEVLANFGRPMYRQIVDWIEGAPLSAVRPDGVIVFVWSYLNQVVRDAVQELRDTAPYLTGRYIANIVLLVNGQQVAGGTGDLVEQARIDINTKGVVVLSTVPYARRLEVGKRKGGGYFIRHGEPHFVQQASIVIANRYRNVADVFFNYFELTDPHLLVPGSPSIRRVRGRTIREIQHPGILIRPRTV